MVFTHHAAAAYISLECDCVARHVTSYPTPNQGESEGKRDGD
jgi:hypothetical protein